MEVTATINLDEYRKVSDDINHYIGYALSEYLTDSQTMKRQLYLRLSMNSWTKTKLATGSILVK